MKLINKIGLITLLGTATLTGCNNSNYSSSDVYEYTGYKDGQIVYNLIEKNDSKLDSITNKSFSDVVNGDLDSVKIFTPNYKISMQNK